MFIAVSHSGVSQDPQGMVLSSDSSTKPIPLGLVLSDKGILMDQIFLSFHLYIVFTLAMYLSNCCRKYCSGSEQCSFNRNVVKVQLKSNSTAWSLETCIRYSELNLCTVKVFDG